MQKECEKLHLATVPSSHLKEHAYTEDSRPHLRSLLFVSSSGGIVQGRFLGKQSNTSSENSEQSMSYSVRMPSVSGSISPAWPKVLASRLREKILQTIKIISKQEVYSQPCWSKVHTLQRSCCLMASWWFGRWTRCWRSRPSGTWNLRDSHPVEH